jgi:hypothetical protein
VSIVNAKDKALSQSPALPDVGVAVTEFFQTLTFGVISQSVDKGYTRDSQSVVSTKGSWQPMSPQQIALKPEGERSWIWATVHCLPDVILYPGDKIIYHGSTFKVMAKRDYSMHGFVEYSVANDFGTRPSGMG